MNKETIKKFIRLGNSLNVNIDQLIVDLQKHDKTKFKELYKSINDEDIEMLYSLKNMFKNNTEKELVSIFYTYKLLKGGNKSKLFSNLLNKAKKINVKKLATHAADLANDLDIDLDNLADIKKNIISMVLDNLKSDEIQEVISQKLSDIIESEELGISNKCIGLIKDNLDDIVSSLFDDIINVITSKLTDKKPKKTKKSKKNKNYDNE